jgi:hypothetical protein
MQQRQSTVSQFTAQSAAASQASAKSAPIALDAATLKLVAGGAQTAGPNGGWSSAVAAGPNGGW